MIGRSFWKHMRNLFENSLPDTDLDREYFDMLEQPDSGIRPSKAAADAHPVPASEDTADVSPPPEADGNRGYIHTVRGVRVSFADINRPRYTTDPSDAGGPANNNELDLARYKPPPRELSPHVLDLHS